MMREQAIGIFDSGYGGLTVMRAICDRLPQYDYIYLGDNARAPYGNRSFETVYQYTKEAVFALFEMGCPLVILACNTASAKALRTIQQVDLPKYFPDRRVLGVIRPTAEVIGTLSQTGNIGILATTGTVQSASYLIEIEKFFPQVKVFQQACPIWVPLIETGEQESLGAQFFIEKCTQQLIQQSKDIDTVLLACTHYPLIAPAIQSALPSGVQLIAQGDIVAEKLADYLDRHTEIASQCGVSGKRLFYTTDDPVSFQEAGRKFYGKDIEAQYLSLNA
jgi:glutamate racemase